MFELSGFFFPLPVAWHFSELILFWGGGGFSVFHYLAAALPLTSRHCFLVSQLMQFASAGLLFPAIEACFLAAVHVRWPPCRSPPSPSSPRPPRPPVPSRQARRLLPCLVETAPLRLARSAAVRAQLRLAGTHVARFHLWVSVWPQERVDISMLMHANADTVASTRVCAEERHAEAHHFQQRAAQRSAQVVRSPVLPPPSHLPPLSFLPPSHPPCHPILQSCPLPGTPPRRHCQPASKTCNLHSELLPAAAGLDMLSSNASWHGLAYPPPSTVAAAVLQIAICWHWEWD